MTYRLFAERLDRLITRFTLITRQASIPEFLKTGLAKIRAHFTTWQLKAIKSVQRPIKKPISDAKQ